MGKFALSNLGYQSLIQKFPPRYDGKPSTLEKITGYPVAGPMLSRFIKVSARGDTEILKSVAKQIRQTRARENLDIQDIVIEYLEKGKPTTKAALKLLYLNMVNDGVMGKTKSGDLRKSFGEFRQLVEEMQVYSYDNPFLNAYLRARSKEEKQDYLYYLLNWKKNPESVVKKKQEYGQDIKDIRLIPKPEVPVIKKPSTTPRMKSWIGNKQP